MLKRMTGVCLMAALAACGGRSNDLTLEGGGKGALGQPLEPAPVPARQAQAAATAPLPGSGVTPVNTEDVRGMTFEERLQEAIKSEKAGDLGRAEICYLMNVDSARETDGKNWKYPAAIRSLALFYHYKSMPEKAERAFNDYIEAQKSIEGPDHPYVASAMIDFTGFLNFVGRFKDSIPLYDQAVDIYARSRGATSPDVIRVMKFKAGALKNLNQPEEVARVEAEIARLEAAPSPTPTPAA